MSSEVVQKQPHHELKNGHNNLNKADDEISYEDSVTHAQSFCCCIHGWKSGPDSRWYYPWDKGMYRLCGIACMWYCLCGFVPCILINKTARDIVCCEGQCTDSHKSSKSDQQGDDEIAEI
jgi:hypothetical protein